MRITLFQMDVSWKDKKANLSKINNLAHNLAGKTNLIICPEMFNTGYIMDPENGGETLNGPTIQKLQTISSKTGITIAGSIPVEKDNQFYNDFIFVNDKGLIFNYSKIHLFSPAGESKHYTSGQNYVDFDLSGFLVRPLICYDLRYPYCSFNTTGYHLLIYTANWPSARIKHWENLLIARAIENQCFVIGINRVGTDHNEYEYPGQSMVVDYTGKVIIQMDETESHESFEPDLPSMLSYRKKFPFLEDRKL